MTLSGKRSDGTDKSLTFELTARAGDGHYIPCMPAIVLAKKLARGELSESGAYPGMGLIALDEYLDALRPLNIEWEVK